MNTLNTLKRLGIITIIFAVSSSVAAQDNRREELAEEIARLEAEITLLEAENEIENLQKIFGFYIDKRFWDQAADLFTEDATIEIGGSGLYRGQERVRAYLNTMGDTGPAEGILNDQMQLQPVIHVAGDGTAKARWHHFSQEAVHGESHHWGAGVYENEYRFEDGVWKISKIHLISTMRTPFDDGWHNTALPRTVPSETLPPDEEPTLEYENYPSIYVAPFHYGNPVTDPYEPELELDVVATDDVSLTQTLDALEKRVGLLNDADEVERLHVIYGYYLARNQWDDLTGIFARDGTIEIAQRGVYRGLPSVRRNLDLYGVQGELPGQLHNHMQYQPVIHVAEDGMTANMRSRALSMMGTYGTQGTWMGGTYENIFIKEDGVWKIGVDQQLNTYFVGFNTGWIDGNRRQPPGINPANPPDEPPSGYFEMYPSAYLPQFHYANPVTGSVVEWENPPRPEE